MRVGGAMLALAVVVIGWAVITAPRYPIAVIRVVDGAGKPVTGAWITPDGVRTKPGPYAGSHYGWLRGTNGPPATPVQTDRNGIAPVPYPKYVFERIETGQISFAVSHPEFVPDRPFRIVTTIPPAGAPVQVWLGYLLQRLKFRALVAQPPPVTLKPGAAVRLTAKNAGPAEDRVFALFSTIAPGDESFWTNPAPGVVLSGQVAPGTNLAQLVQLDRDGVASFSDVVPVTAALGNACDVQLELRRGLVVSGQLDPSIRRPIRHGRVIAQVTSLHTQARDQPPQWHAWTEAREDGTFRFASLPPGFLEISAICDGFISTNGPGQSSLRHPQPHELGPGDLELVIGMEPTARLEVTLLGPGGKPVPDARVVTWPNIQYGDWAATIFGDCYNTADFLRKTVTRENWSRSMPPDFEGTSDSNGLAVVPNVPAEVNQFAVEHGALQLPAVDSGVGEKRRDATVTLVRGRTNRVTVRLEPRTASQISHY